MNFLKFFNCALITSLDRKTINPFVCYKLCVQVVYLHFFTLSSGVVCADVYVLLCHDSGRLADLLRGSQTPLWF